MLIEELWKEDARVVSVQDGAASGSIHQGWWFGSIGEGQLVAPVGGHQLWRTKIKVRLQTKHNHAEKE